MHRIVCSLCLLIVLLCGCTSHPVAPETTLPTESVAATTEVQVPATQAPYVYGVNLNWDELHVYDFPERCSFAHSNVWLDAEDFIPMDREEALAFFDLEFNLTQVLSDIRIDTEGMNYGVYFDESKGYYETENMFRWILPAGSITAILTREASLRIFPQDAYDVPNYGVINGCNVLLGQYEGENREIYAQLTVGQNNVLLRFRDVSQRDVLAVLDYLTMQNK